MLTYVCVSFRSFFLFFLPSGKGVGCGTDKVPPTMHLMQLTFEPAIAPDRTYDYKDTRAPQTQTEKQPLRGGAVVVDGARTSANLRLSGQPADCENGSLNGEWIYQGTTADGKKYYMRDTKWGGYGVLYLFFDKNGDAGTKPDTCEYHNYWLIGDVKPSQTKIMDLDGDLNCLGAGVLYGGGDTSGALTPPATGSWKVGCSSRPKGTPKVTEMRLMQLSFEPVCGDVAPDWKYAYPADWSVVNKGCGVGIWRQRTEVQSCSAPLGCSCKNTRAPQTETEERCYVAFGGSPLDAD